MPLSARTVALALDPHTPPNHPQLARYHAARYVACAARWRERGDRRAAAHYLNRAVHSWRRAAAAVLFPRPRGAA